MSNTLWILGAADPEMEKIRDFLRAAGQMYTYAMVGGQRASPSQAYRADPPPDHYLGATRYVLVECSVGGIPDGAEVVVVDHHRPGNPGYGKPPEDYWPASSIGQVCALLGRWGFGPVLREGLGWSRRWSRWGRLWLPRDYTAFLAAAADHCLAAAYAGRCPEIDPQELAEWRIETRAAFQRMPMDELRQKVEAAVAALQDAPRIGPYGVADLRDRFVPELPEAGARTGIPYLARLEDAGRMAWKVVIGGAGEGTRAGPEPVRWFMEEWAPSQGLVGIYGDPARGYAGGYESDGGRKEQ